MKERAPENFRVDYAVSLGADERGGGEDVHPDPDGGVQRGIVRASEEAQHKMSAAKFSS